MSGIRCSLLLCVALLFLFGCSDELEKAADSKENPGSQEGTVRELERQPDLISLLPRDAYRLLQDDPAVVVVDVRSAEERSGARISGSVSASLSDIMNGSETLPRNRPLLLVCAVGGRSYGAGLYLHKHGYPVVYNLRGGIHGWSREGLPLVTGP